MLEERRPFSRLQANTLAKEGSTVSPPAKKAINRQAGAPLQSNRSKLRPAGDRAVQVPKRKSRFAPAAQANQKTGDEYIHPGRAAMAATGQAQIEPASAARSASEAEALNRMSITFAPAVQPASFRSRLRQPVGISSRLGTENSTRAQLTAHESSAVAYQPSEAAETPVLLWKTSQMALASPCVAQQPVQTTNIGDSVSPLVFDLKPSRIPRLAKESEETSRTVSSSQGNARSRQTAAGLDGLQLLPQPQVARQEDESSRGSTSTSSSNSLGSQMSASQQAAWSQAGLYLVDNPLAEHQTSPANGLVFAPAADAIGYTPALLKPRDEPGTALEGSASGGCQGGNQVPFSFGGVAAAHSGSTPELLLDQSLICRLQGWNITAATPARSTARFPDSGSRSLAGQAPNSAFPASEGMLPHGEESQCLQSSKAAVVRQCLFSPGLESVDSCPSTDRDFSLAPLQAVDDLAAQSQCSKHHGQMHPSRAVRLARPVSSGNPHIDASSLGVASPPARAVLRGVPAEEAEGPPSSAGSGARPYLNMLRHLRGAPYDSPNLGNPAATGCPPAALEDSETSPATPREHLNATLLASVSQGWAAARVTHSLQQPSFCSPSPASSKGSTQTQSGSHASSPMANTLSTAGSSCSSPNVAQSPQASAEQPLHGQGPSHVHSPHSRPPHNSAAFGELVGVDLPNNCFEVRSPSVSGSQATAHVGSPDSQGLCAEGALSLGRGELQEWMEQTGLKDVTTPARQGLQAMWGAAGEVKALKSAIKQVAACELEIAAEEAVEAAFYWEKMIKHSNALAADNRRLHEELTAVQEHLAALQSQHSSHAVVAAARLAEVQQLSDILAARHEEEKEDLLQQLHLAQMEFPSVEDMAACANPEAAASANQHPASQNEIQQQNQPELARDSTAAAEGDAVVAADDTAPQAVPAAQAALGGAALQAAAAVTSASEQAMPQGPDSVGKVAAQLGEEAADVAPTGPSVLTHARAHDQIGEIGEIGSAAAAELASQQHYNIQLRSQLAAALQQLSIMSPRQAQPDSIHDVSHGVHSPEAACSDATVAGRLEDRFGNNCSPTNSGDCSIASRESPELHHAELQGESGAEDQQASSASIVCPAAAFPAVPLETLQQQAQALQQQHPANTPASSASSPCDDHRGRSTGNDTSILLQVAFDSDDENPEGSTVPTVHVKAHLEPSDVPELQGHLSAIDTGGMQRGERCDAILTPAVSAALPPQTNNSPAAATEGVVSLAGGTPLQMQLGQAAGAESDCAPWLADRTFVPESPMVELAFVSESPRVTSDGQGESRASDITPIEDHGSRLQSFASSEAVAGSPAAEATLGFEGQEGIQSTCEACQETVPSPGFIPPAPFDTPPAALHAVSACDAPPLHYGHDCSRSSSSRPSHDNSAANAPNDHGEGAASGEDLTLSAEASTDDAAAVPPETICSPPDSPSADEPPAPQLIAVPAAICAQPETYDADSDSSDDGGTPGRYMPERLASTISCDALDASSVGTLVASSKAPQSPGREPVLTADTEDIKSETSSAASVAVQGGHMEQSPLPSTAAAAFLPQTEGQTADDLSEAGSDGNRAQHLTDAVEQHTPSPTDPRASSDHSIAIDIDIDAPGVDEAERELPSAAYFTFDHAAADTAAVSELCMPPELVCSPCTPVSNGASKLELNDGAIYGQGSTTEVVNSGAMPSDLQLTKDCSPTTPGPRDSECESTHTTSGQVQDDSAAADELIGSQASSTPMTSVPIEYGKSRLPEFSSPQIKSSLSPVISFIGLGNNDSTLHTIPPDADSQVPSPCNDIGSGVKSDAQSLSSASHSSSTESNAGTYDLPPEPHQHVAATPVSALNSESVPGVFCSSSQLSLSDLTMCHDGLLQSDRADSTASQTCSAEGSATNLEDILEFTFSPVASRDSPAANSATSASENGSPIVEIGDSSLHTPASSRLGVSSASSAAASLATYLGESPTRYTPATFCSGSGGSASTGGLSPLSDDDGSCRSLDATFGGFQTSIAFDSPRILPPDTQPSVARTAINDKAAAAGATGKSSMWLFDSSDDEESPNEAATNTLAAADVAAAAAAPQQPITLPAAEAVSTMTPSQADSHVTAGSAPVADGTMDVAPSAHTPWPVLRLPDDTCDGSVSEPAPGSTGLMLNLTPGYTPQPLVATLNADVNQGVCLEQPITTGASDLGNIAAESMPAVVDGDVSSDVGEDSVRNTGLQDEQTPVTPAPPATPCCNSRAACHASPTAEPSPGDILRKGGVVAAVRHFDQGGYGAVPLPRPPFLAAAYFSKPAFAAALATPLPPDRAPECPASDTSLTGTSDQEALTPISALAASLNDGNEGSSAPSTPVSLPTTSEGSTSSAVIPGWSGITARLQRLRADLQATHARLRIVAQPAQESSEADSTASIFPDTPSSSESTPMFPVPPRRSSSPVEGLLQSSGSVPRLTMPAHVPLNAESAKASPPGLKTPADSRGSPPAMHEANARQPQCAIPNNAAVGHEPAASDMPASSSTYGSKLAAASPHFTTPGIRAVSESPAAMTPWPACMPPAHRPYVIGRATPQLVAGYDSSDDDRPQTVG